MLNVYTHLLGYCHKTHTHAVVEEELVLEVNDDRTVFYVDKETRSRIE